MRSVKEQPFEVGRVQKKKKLEGGGKGQMCLIIEKSKVRFKTRHDFWFW